MRKRSHAERLVRKCILLTPDDAARLDTVVKYRGRSGNEAISYLLRKHMAPTFVDVPIALPFETVAQATEMCKEIGFGGNVNDWIEKSLIDSIGGAYKEFLLSKSIKA